MEDLTTLQGSCSMMYSAIVTTYGEPMKTLHRAIDSIIAQGIESFEVIVVNDGHPDLEGFKKLAETYRANHRDLWRTSPDLWRTSPVRSVDTTFIEEVEQDVLNRDGSVNTDLLRVRELCPPTGVVKFVSKPNGGLGSARNFGISFASGVWIHPIDADDTISKDFIGEVIDGLRLSTSSGDEKIRTLGNPADYNIIMPWMGDHEGKIISWEPKNIDDVDIKFENAYHCCGMFLRAIWDGGIRYNSMLVFGWEDWDFWLNVDTAIGVDTLLVKKPLYHYHSWGSKEKHMASYCGQNKLLCQAVFHFANYDKYDERVLADDVKALTEPGNGILKLTEHAAWKHIEGVAMSGDRVGKLLLALAASSGYRAQATGTGSTYVSSIMQELGALKTAYCRDDKFQVLLSLVARAKSEAEQKHHRKRIACVDVDQKGTQEESILSCEGLDDMLSRRLVKTAGKPKVFHIIVSEYPTNWKWVKLLHHTIIGALSFNPDAMVVIHSPLPTIANIFDDGFLKVLFPRLRLASMCGDKFSTIAGMEHVHDFMKRRAKGRPFFYSHFTDFYRMLLLYLYGGTYLDADIVLRTDVTYLDNVLAREDEKYLNGAYLSFDARHNFLKYCLEMIPEVYDPYIWGIIGPHLVTKANNHFEATSHAPTVLPVEALYFVHHSKRIELIAGVNLDREEYDRRGGHGLHSQIGYHFWSKMLFKDDFTIEQESPGGWALSDTCLCDYMDCLMMEEGKNGRCQANVALGLLATYDLA
ncbi:hypothetical protein TrST_g14285 [Triparma strigata]|uniref:Uncharacterized protein n=1 Tax=Triparma strigata TaxID=1606541 RepID=A0A9W7F655_9STRA|nr:hypothetical protein TrST_g14285 [Triparma strigata]